MASHPVVLLAEDNPEMLELISTRLMREGMKVVEVGNGVELHDYLIQCRAGGVELRPDLIVSDVDMPRESGPAALKRARARQPVILITADPSPQVRAAAAEAGVCAIFKKPFALAELVAKILEVLKPPTLPASGAPA